ncbi:hypothetical protein [Caldithrix abyssi]|uniref:hypothetical protein n=1 Tax=Caldithrix abyssi TaxID=187145 RepID=UPI0005C77D40|nr:hypothetical protein [Caldithrix abyssi]
MSDIIIWQQSRNQNQTQSAQSNFLADYANQRKKRLNKLFQATTESSEKSQRRKYYFKLEIVSIVLTPFQEKESGRG